MLILVYGVPKSASTFATALARTMAQAAGHDQGTLRNDYIAGDDKTGFVADLTTLGTIDACLPESALLVLKTHSPRNVTVDKLERAGRLRSIVTYRDPRDAALSAFEAAEKARAAGNTYQRFVELRSLDEAIESTLRHIDDVARAWLLAPDPLKLDYDYLTGSPEAAGDIARHLSLDPTTATTAVRHLVSGKQRVYNFNVGESGRHRAHFDAAQLHEVERRVGDYVRYCEGVHAALRRDATASPLEKITRRLRAGLLRATSWRRDRK
ncbi:MAG: hypothetical protein ACU85U_21020 [Gammaproteobacteria bacterium]|jgi:hypothetical protein